MDVNGKQVNISANLCARFKILFGRNRIHENARRHCTPFSTVILKCALHCVADSNLYLQCLPDEQRNAVLTIRLAVSLNLSTRKPSYAKEIATLISEKIPLLVLLLPGLIFKTSELTTMFILKFICNAYINAYIKVVHCETYSFDRVETICLSLCASTNLYSLR